MKNFRILVEDKSEFFYSISPFGINNPSGVVIAVLNEYYITNKREEVFQLYKSKDGNWFNPGC